MKGIKLLVLLGALMLHSTSDLEARIKLIKFSNQSDMQFQESFVDGTPYKFLLDLDKAVFIDQEGAEIETVDGNFKIILEDAHRSGYHRPHWKYHVWLESKTGFPFFAGDKILYAVVFYDGDGEVKLSIDKQGKLHVKGGYDVKDILYPWAKGTIGRGNPYHQIHGIQTDDNGVNYFDYDGFVAFPYNLYND